MDYWEIKRILEYPFDCDFIMKKQRMIERLLLTNEFFVKKKIAILGGSTTSEIKNILNIFLLAEGIEPIFYESQYNRYYEECVFPNPELDNFSPDIIFLHTSCVNLHYLPQVCDSSEQIDEKIEKEFSRYQEIWSCIQNKYNCAIIQNNFEFPQYRTVGSQDCVSFHGVVRYINDLNRKFSSYAEAHSSFYIHDICYLAARIGLNSWLNPLQYYAYKFSVGYDRIPEYSYSVAQIIKSLLGKSKKCLVLDLDNTLWGGVVGDDGINAIRIGRETPEGEAYLAFQAYVLGLKKRGIILAVSSKNDEETAKEGFLHPDSILSINDFAVFKANWRPKHRNIIEIAKELNIGLDSMVFVDDNPVERQIVRENLPGVAVPEIDMNDVSSYMRILECAGYFDTLSVSKDDLIRAQSYKENHDRKNYACSFSRYEDFLQSLKMKAEIKSFVPAYLERITQLTNKSNQFNLTTKRYTFAQLDKISNDSQYITLYGRLTDKFGDNGLVSVIIGEIRGVGLHINLWLMSCRVLQRGMEYAMFSCLLKEVKNRGLKSIFGYYYHTKKNSIVAEFYKDLEFQLMDKNEQDTIWRYDIFNHKDEKEIKKSYIEIT